MLKKLEEKLSRLKLKIVGDISFDIEMPEIATPRKVIDLVDEKKSQIEAILGLNETPVIEIKLLDQTDAAEVYDFLKNSTDHHGPFSQVIRSKCDTIDKVKHELGPWESRQTYHNLYFGCYLIHPEKADVKIMIGGIVAGVVPESQEIEIGGLTRNHSKGKGFGKNSVTQVLHELKGYIQAHNLDIERITSVVSDHDNIAAQRMLASSGFEYIKTGKDGVLYAHFLK